MAARAVAARPGDAGAAEVPGAVAARPGDAGAAEVPGAVAARPGDAGAAEVPGAVAVTSAGGAGVVGGTEAIWSSRSISCLTERTKSPGVRSGDSSRTASRRAPRAQR